jgi:hypothetical protein
MLDVPYNPPNPLDTANKAIGLANSIQQNALIKQQIINSGIVGQQAQSNLNDSLNDQLGRITLAHGLYGEQTPAAYKAEIDRIVAINPALASAAQVWKSQIPDNATAPQLQQMAFQHASALLDPKVQTELGPTGQVQFVNTGAGIQAMRVPGGLGAAVGAQPYQTGSTLPLGLSPQTAQVYDPNAGGPGVGGMVTKTIGGGYGAPPPVPGAVQAPSNALTAPIPASMIPPPAGSVQPGKGGVPYNGPLPQGSVIGPDGKPWPTMIAPSGTPARPGQVSTMPPWTNTQPGGVTTPPGVNPFASAPPIGQQASTEQNQQAFRNAQAEASTIPLQNSQYIEAHNAIQNLQDSDFTTGIGSGRANKVRQLMVQLGAGPETVANVTNAATAEKYLAAAIANKAPGSDARQDLLQHANPSVAMPPGATLPIIRQIVASNRAKQAVLQTAPDPVNGNGFLAHQATQSQALNTPEGLKALSWDITPKADQVKILADIKAKGATAMNNFESALQIAHDNKLLGGQ